MDAEDRKVLHHYKDFYNGSQNVIAIKILLKYQNLVTTRPTH